jgi:hypothetical protein
MECQSPKKYLFVRREDARCPPTHPKVIQCIVKHDSSVRYTCGAKQSDATQYTFAARSTGRATNI